MLIALLLPSVALTVCTPGRTDALVGVLPAGDYPTAVVGINPLVTLCSQQVPA